MLKGQDSGQWLRTPSTTVAKGKRPSLPPPPLSPPLSLFLPLPSLLFPFLILLIFASPSSSSLSPPLPPLLLMPLLSSPLTPPFLPPCPSFPSSSFSLSAPPPPLPPSSPSSSSFPSSPPPPSLYLFLLLTLFLL